MIAHGSRARRWDEATSTEWELVVVGAGINGAAIAREAVLRGVRTLLLDARDLGSGTSSASSRLIHGGPRYLENGEVRLVRQSLRERERLLRAAPHLVSPYPLLIPMYRDDRRRPWTMRAGMLAYDALSWDKSTPHHRALSAPEALSQVPGLDPTRLTGAILYVDAYAFLAERLVVEQALDVAGCGGQVLTHAAARDIEPGVSGLEVEVSDSLGGRVAAVRTRCLVNAAGPWVDGVLSHVRRVRPGRLIGAVKGSHIVLGPFPGAPLIGIHREARADGRPILVLPQVDGTVLVGSTEVVLTDVEAVEADQCSGPEAAYLLAELNTLIPEARVGREDIMYAYAGARPLPYEPDAVSAAEVSRDHRLHQHEGAPGLFSLTGGKLTTHRAVGELAADRVLDHLDHGRPSRPGAGSGPMHRWRRATAGGRMSPTRVVPLPGGRVRDWPGFVRAFHAGTANLLDLPTRRRLLATYGVRARGLLASADGQSHRDPLAGLGDDVLDAEIAMSLEQEFAETLQDVLARRLVLVRRPDLGRSAAAPVADLCQSAVGWTEQRRLREVAQYNSWIERFKPGVGVPHDGGYRGDLHQTPTPETMRT